MVDKCTANNKKYKKPERDADLKRMIWRKLFN